MSNPGTLEGSVEFVPLSLATVGAYQTFARDHFGPASHQAQQSYLTWMYEEAPHAPAGLEEAKLAVAQGRVVGCFHKMRLPWIWGGSTALVSSPHSLMVDPRFRTGVGLGLIAEAFRGEKHQLLIGAGPSVTRIYEKLGARPVTSYWLRTALNPFTIPAIAAFHRAAPIAMDAVISRTHAAVDRAHLPARSIEVRSSLDEELASHVARMLLRASGSAAHIQWTPDLVRWRFFSKYGPRHLLVCLGPGQDARAFAIVSLGVHRTLALARTVEWYAESKRWGFCLGVVVRALLSVMGANAWFAMTSDPRRAASWRGIGFWNAREPPMIYELHSPRIQSFGPLCLGGAAGDHGFEAIPLDKT
jgi:hypothetical protein